MERMKQAAWWKAQGVFPGIADIVVWGPGLCCGIELKVKGNKPTPAEIAFGEAMHACGHHWFAAWSVVEVDAGLRRVGFNLARSMAIAAQGHDLALTVPEPSASRARRVPRSAARNWRGRVGSGYRVAGRGLGTFLSEPMRRYAYGKYLKRKGREETRAWFTRTTHLGWN